MQLVGKYCGTLHLWVCAPDRRGSVLVLGRKWWLGGSKLRPWGWAGHERPRSFPMALWWAWAPTNQGDKPELQMHWWGSTYRSGGPYPKNVEEASVGQESLSLAETVEHSRKDKLRVIYFWLMFPGELIKINLHPLSIVCVSLWLEWCFGHVLAMLAELKASYVHELEESISSNTF